MSGLLERIARRRRATANSRLGPPSQNRISHADDGAHEIVASANGGPPEDAPAPSLNGTAPELAAQEADAAVEVVGWTPPEVQVAVERLDEAPEAEVAADEVEEAPEAEVAPEPEPEAEAGAAPQPDPEPEAEAAPEPDPEPEAEVAPEPEPEPQAEIAPPTPAPSFVERGRLRQRARYLRRLREVQLRDIGGFLVELHRFGRERPDLVEAKIAGAASVDAELRALEHALGSEQPLRELREAGIGGACSSCGAVHGTGDRFCSSCGAALADDAR
jgi:hypothetical protein